MLFQLVLEAFSLVNIILAYLKNGRFIYLRNEIICVFIQLLISFRKLTLWKFYRKIIAIRKLLTFLGFMEFFVGFLNFFLSLSLSRKPEQHSEE